jgi:predicted CopG family antitoxin
MRYINIDRLPVIYNHLHGEGAFEIWVQIAEQHLTKIRALSKKERADYWAKNNHWGGLYSALSNLSEGKCWYTEAPENSAEWEIEHYRPKAKAIIKNQLTLNDGYWWLSYYWRNFRLTGSLVNKRRKDRFTEEEDVLGKGNFFPLEETSPCAEPEDFYCREERPLLLDPVKPRDCLLLSFDKNGDVFPTYFEEGNSYLMNKAVVSIEYYGLRHTPLIRGRSKIWQACDSIVDIANNDLRRYFNDEVKRETTVDNCYFELAKMSSITEPFSMVVKSFVKIKSKEKNFEWLGDAIHTLQN